MKIEPHKYLENLLAHWEDICDMHYFNAALAAGVPSKYSYDLPVDGPLVHARTLRRHILASGNDRLDLDKYIYGSKPGFPEKWLKRSPCYSNFPVFLFDWCRNSRRIYRLSEVLTDLLSLTTVDDVKWSEIRFPFTSFVVELESGISDERGMIHHFLMVTLVEENNVKKFVMTSVARKEGFYPILPKHILAQVRLLLMQQKWEKVFWLIQKLNDQADNTSTMFTAPLLVSDEKTVGQMIAEMENRVWSNGQNMMQANPQVATIATRLIRTVIGFSLYLRTLPSGSPHLGNWEAVKSSTKDKTAITGEMFVCSVTSSQKLTAEEHADIKEYLAGTQKGYELRAHFREGHWRRPPGKGNDPTAEKTIWVRACIVRKDRLDKNSLPVGALQQT